MYVYIYIYIHIYIYIYRHTSRILFCSVIITGEEFSLSIFSLYVHILFFNEWRRVYLLQEYSQEAVAHVHKYLMKNEVPVDLFEVGHCLVTLSTRLRLPNRYYS